MLQNIFHNNPMQPFKRFKVIRPKKKKKKRKNSIEAKATFDQVINK